MQVKKFEARSMKEALDMIKTSLGPEAIILNAKDIRSGFGLAGEKSVEVTAAVSEEMLRKKALAENKLNQSNRERYVGSPAKKQKEFIDRIFEKQRREQEQKMRTITSTPYIDIGDSDQQSWSTSSLDAGFEEVQAQQDVSIRSPQAIEEAQAEKRIRGAAARALDGAMDFFKEERHQEAPVQASRSAAEDSAEVDNDEILRLRREIHRLKKVVKNFQQVPQTFTTLHPGADEGIPFELSFMYEKLQRVGVGKAFVVKALKELERVLPREKLKKKAFVSAWMAKYILDHTKVADNRTVNKYHVFVGPSGHGKTASLVKLASHMVICEKKSVAIVTTDTRKLGAAEQLKIYSQILNVPFAVIRRKQDWQILDQKLAKVDAILVDSPGMNLKGMNETDFLRDIMPPETGGRSVHYVQSALARDEAAFEIASRYKMLGIDDVIFTNIDETTHHGIIFNFQQKFDIPLHSFGIGTQIPEDFEPATKERVVDLIFKLTNMRKQEAMDE